MKSDHTELETALQQLQPGPLSATLLARLDAAAAGTSSILSHRELELENELLRYTPAPLSAGLLDQFAELTAGIPFPQSRNIVGFPHRAAAAKRQTQRPLWAAAAAVALLGALTAWMMPPGRAAHGSLANTARYSPMISPMAASKVVSASFNRGLSDVRDEGVIWDHQQNPHRVMKTTYLDRVTVKNAQGGFTEVEQPRVEYMVVPDRID
jgi:hypothetical protein